MSKIRIGIAIAVLCAIALTSTAVFAQDNSAREKDRAEIEELMWRYTRALDSHDGATYAAAYTVDGQFGTGANATKGREALKKMVDNLKATAAAAEAKGEPKRPPLYHMEANSWIEFIDKDHARHHARAADGGGQRAQPGARPIAGGGRELSAAALERAICSIDGRVVGHREPPRGRADAL